MGTLHDLKLHVKKENVHMCRSCCEVPFPARGVDTHIVHTDRRIDAASLADSGHAKAGTLFVPSHAEIPQLGQTQIVISLPPPIAGQFN